MIDLNVRSHYPYSDDYIYETSLEIIDLDKERIRDITSGNGFIISAARAIKDDLKDDNGIFSTKYGQTLQDQSPYGMRYRCKCGATKKRFYNGQICKVCGHPVKYVDDNFTYFGWITLKDPYHVIHPNLYMNIASLIGPTVFNNIISPNDQKDENGNEVPVVRTKEEPFKKIGMMQFYERFDEIIDFYVSKRPEKKDHYDLIREHREKVFSQSIPVYTIHLRPYKLEGGELHYEDTNAIFNMMAHFATRINNDRYKINQKSKPKEQLLYNLQQKIMELDEETNKIMSGKRGCIRTLLGGRLIIRPCIERFIQVFAVNCWKAKLNNFNMLISSQTSMDEGSTTSW